MKFKLFIAVMLMLASVIIGCAAKKTNAEETSKTSAVQTESATEEEKITVSPYAEEDFLTPLEDFSWEREYEPEYLVLHFTSAVVKSKDNPYDIQAIRNIFIDSEVSINYIIDRDGKVHCYIPENRAAWHAGVGSFANEERFTNSMNKYSIGIEIMAIGSQNDMKQYLTEQEYNSLDSEFIGFTEMQYEALGVLARDICQRNGIPFDKEHVIGHDEYNPAKSDPGELFDYERLFAQ